jgi:dethiobiotin synthetase
MNAMDAGVSDPDAPASPGGLFVTGTGTDVGKTILSAALVAAIHAAGRPVRACKPIVSGIGGPPGAWPADHVLLGSLCGLQPEEVSPLRYGAAVSPHLAAKMLAKPVHASEVIAIATDAAAQAATQGATLIVEGLGGLLAPLTDELSVRSLAVRLGLPLLIAAPPGLGTINHALLSLEAARTARLHPLAVVLTPWPAEPSAIERSNRETIERLGEVEVTVLPHISPPGPDVDADAAARLAVAGDALPWRRWLTEAPATRPA